MRRVLRRPTRVSAGGGAANQFAQYGALVLDLNPDIGVTVADTDKIEQINDQSGFGNDLVRDPGADSLRPALISGDSDFNGHNSISAAATNRMMVSDDASVRATSAGMTWYLVVYKAAAANANERILTKDATTDEYVLRGNRASDGQPELFIRNGADSAWYNPSSTTVIDDDDAHLITVSFNGTTATSIQVDAAMAGLDTDTGVSNGTDDLLFFSRANGGEAATVKVARVLFYQEALGASANTAITTELNAIYGL